MKTTSLSPSTRRRFLATALAAASGLLMPGIGQLHAAPTDVGSTDHFWYRLAPEGPYIDSQRANKAFGFGLGKVFLSEDKSSARDPPFALTG